jgi:hypothetical protein
VSDEIRKAVLTVAPMPPAPGDGGSTQPLDDDPWTPEGSLPPPADLDNLAALTQVGRIRRSCIAAIAHNTVGLGFELAVREGHEDEIKGEVDEERREARDELNRLARRDAMLKRPSFGRLLTAVIWDKYECGNGYLEVARNKITGKISGLYHAPGKRIRRTKERDGWIMLRQAGTLTNAVRFYDFGAKVKYGPDGQPTNKLAGSGMRWDRNELIPFQLYTSESRDYGLPPDAQLAIDYLGDKLAGDTNASFFGSSGVPPTVIFVQGEEKGDGSEVRIEVPPAFVKQVADAMRGGTAQSRVAIIGVPAGFKAQVNNLAVTSERDMGFIAYRGDNRRATLGAFRLSPVFVADIEDAGKYTAEVERAITKEQVFDPEQEEVQDALDHSLLAELFPHLALDFNEIAIKGDEAKRQSANDLADRGKITNAEYRTAHGYPPMPEAAEGAEPQEGEVEFGWNSELVTSKQAALAPPGPEAEFFEKAAGTTRSITETFEDAVEDAIRRVHEIDPDADVSPVVVEKVGGEVVIHAGNGAGP